MALTVYADFTCPASYLASGRVDALRAAGVPVSWCAVEFEPTLPISGQRLDAAAQDRLTARFAEFDALMLNGERLPWRMPATQPKTEAAVSAYAEASEAGVGDDVRRLLFELYWQRGADIGSPAVLRAPIADPILRGHSRVEALRQSGYAVSVDRGPISSAAYHLIRDWRAQWRELTTTTLVVRADTEILSGTEALQRLGGELERAGGHFPVTCTPTPGDWPAQTHPHAGWVSEIGGRWVPAYRSAAFGRTGRA